MKKQTFPILLATGLSVAVFAAPTVEKALTGEPLVQGQASALLKSADGFAPTGDYTVEMKLKPAHSAKSLVRIFGEAGDRSGYTFTVGDTSVVFHDPTILPYPDVVFERLNSQKDVTLRLAVSGDSVYIYREGMLVGQRSMRYAPLPVETAEEQYDSPNLVVNGDFESKAGITENVITEEKGATCLRTMDAWFIYPNDDVWNSRTYLQTSGDGTCLRIQRYDWNSGGQWTDGIVQQAVNVVGGTPYHFSFRAYGGEFNGTYYGYAKLVEPETGKSKTINITSADSFEEYVLDYTPSDKCTKLQIIFGVKFPGGLLDWGEVPKVPVYVDDVVLSGKAYRHSAAALGFDTAEGATVTSLSYDGTGAYAPIQASITTDVSRVTIDAATGSNTAKVAVTARGLKEGEMITFLPSPYVTVAPPKLPYNAAGQNITIKYDGTRDHVIDTLFIKSGMVVCPVVLDIKGKPLDHGALAHTETPTAKTYSVPLTASGAYSVEVRAQVKEGAKDGLKLYAAGADGRGYGIFVADSALTADNGKSAQENPLTIASRKNSDLQHTFRVAVSPDNLLYIYRDGNLAATLDAADFIIPAEFATGVKDSDDNLLSNADFDGTYEVAYVEDGGPKPYVSKIQGWDIYPVEPWNTRQQIVRWEINEDEGYDFTNKALMLHRYGWNKGFSDGLISQAVNVTPGQKYTLTFLAAGGIHNNVKYGYVRIEEVANSTKGVTQAISSDKPKAYTMSYTPSAGCRQIRVVIGLKSPGAIGDWGAVPEVPIYVDKLVLKGQKAVGNGTIGFVADEGTVVEHFAYDFDNAYAPAQPTITVDNADVRIDGTGKAAIIRITGTNLNAGEDINIITPEGIEAKPAKVAYDAAGAIVRLELTSQVKRLLTNVILRSGTTKAVVKVDGRGTPLEQKDLSASPIYTGSDASWSHTEADGFKPGADGYTVEYRAKMQLNTAEMAVTAVDASAAVHPFNTKVKTGIYNGTDAVNRKTLAPDLDYHTYRYAVTADRHIFVYRDGAPIDTLMVDDYANPTSLVGTAAGNQPNLLHNPGFEGFAKTYVMTDDSDAEVFYNYVQGWSILDGSNGWNARTYIENKTMSDFMGDDNHVMSIERYRWEDGWTDAKVSQVIDVVPGTPYKLSVMAMGGFRKSDDKSLGFIRIEEVKTPAKGKEVSLTEATRYEFGRYNLSYTPSSSCTQIRVILGLKKAGKGNECERVYFDDAILTGQGVTFAPKISMANSNATLEYLTYDVTGAYAPEMPDFTISDEELTFDHTLAERVITVGSADVKDTDKIKLEARGNFVVEPEELTANTANNSVTITFTGTTDGTGALVVSAGAFSQTVALSGAASPLELKDISNDPVYTGAEGAYTAEPSTGFAPTKAGYTIELAGSLDQYSGGSFEIGALNAKEVGPNLIISDEFTATSFEQGNIDFIGNGSDIISNVGNFVYRITVTPDNKAFIFKNSVMVDTIDITSAPADLAFLRPDVSIDSDNLVRNGNFNGSYEYTQYDEAYMLSSLAGWHTSGLNEWNARAYIIADAENPGNNILNIQRYEWNAGWADALFSQVVNVCPNTTYTLSADTRGGAQDGFKLASMDISEVGFGHSKSTNISNENSEFSTQTVTYTTGADCHQLKIAFRLASSGEDHGPKANLYIKNVRLSGKKPLFDAGIYLRSEAPFKLKYFTFDLTGAYMPADWVGVDDIFGDDDAEAIECGTAPGLITLRNLPSEALISVYDISGKTVAATAAIASSQDIEVAAGYYLVTVANDANTVTFKVAVR